MMATLPAALPASYEAKAFGVRTGTSSPTLNGCARRSFWSRGSRDLHGIHHRIVEAVESCLPVTAVLSIDEMAAAFMGRERPLLCRDGVGRKVKARILERVGPIMRSSVGLGHQPLPGKGGQRHGKAQRLGSTAARYSSEALAAYLARPARTRCENREAPEREGIRHHGPTACAHLRARPASSGLAVWGERCGTGSRAKT